MGAGRGEGAEAVTDSVEVFPGIVCRKGDFRHKVVGAWIQPEVLSGGFLAGDTREQIMRDYGVTAEHFDTAIRWGLLSSATRRRRLKRAWAQLEAAPAKEKG